MFFWFSLQNGPHLLQHRRYAPCLALQSGKLSYQKWKTVTYSYTFRMCFCFLHFIEAFFGISPKYISRSHLQETILIFKPKVNCKIKKIYNKQYRLQKNGIRDHYALCYKQVNTVLLVASQRIHFFKCQLHWYHCYRRTRESGSQCGKTPARRGCTSITDVTFMFSVFR